MKRLLLLVVLAIAGCDIGYEHPGRVSVYLDPADNIFRDMRRIDQPPPPPYYVR